MLAGRGRSRLRSGEAPGHPDEFGFTGILDTRIAFVAALNPLDLVRVRLYNLAKTHLSTCVVVHWVPGQGRVEGEERADKLAKEAVHKVGGVSRRWRTGAGERRRLGEANGLSLSVLSLRTAAQAKAAARRRMRKARKILSDAEAAFDPPS